MKGDHGLKIDLMLLYTQGGHKSWNAYLAKCRASGDMHSLERTLKGIQMGMEDLAKQKLNTDEINAWFARLTRSIEKTMQEIVRTRLPNPCDNPLKASQFAEASQLKKQRDLSFETYLKSIRY